MMLFDAKAVEPGTAESGSRRQKSSLARFVVFITHIKVSCFNIAQRESASLTSPYFFASIRPSPASPREMCLRRSLYFEGNGEGHGPASGRPVDCC